ncbi:MAG: Hypoxic response protein 1 [Candidatus Heimdallarchaeota archaeon LC_2]|nr:MAG: Hypoxic response protein 1 [Candidatus Heimdallarchaeota archaeon LC_2]
MAQVISIATQNPTSLRPIGLVSEAVEIMSKLHFRRIPIVWEDSLVGIVTARDLLYLIENKGLSVLTDELQYHMVKEPIFVYRDVELGDAVKLMFEHNIGSLPIVSERDRTLAGIVTERDLVRAFTENIFADADLREFISTVPTTAPYKTSTVMKIMKIMAKQKIRRVILIDSKNIVMGVITASDILRYISEHIVRTGEPEGDILKEKISTITNPDVTVVDINESVSEVAKLLIEKGIGGVPVIDENKELMGVFTERDILLLVGTYNLM